MKIDAATGSIEVTGPSAAATVRVKLTEATRVTAASTQPSANAARCRHRGRASTSTTVLSTTVAAPMGMRQRNR